MRKYIYFVLLIAILLANTSCSNSKIDNVKQSSSEITTKTSSSEITTKTNKKTISQIVIANNAQIEGNTSANILNGGYVLQSKNNVIYHVMNLDGIGSGIFKWDDNSKQDIKISNDSPSVLNLVDDWLYYFSNNQFKRVKVDGSSSTTLLANFSVNEPQVVGDWIYYYNKESIGSPCSIWKLRNDGSQNIKIVDNINWAQDTFCVENDWIYYLDNGESIYKIKTDGTQKTCILENSAVRINVIKNYIYFISNETLYRINLDGTNKVKISEDDINYFNVTESNIYYCCTNGLFKTDIEGKNLLKLADGKNIGGCNYVNVVGDWVYYTINNIDGCTYYRVKIDGTSDEKFPPNQS